MHQPGHLDLRAFPILGRKSKDCKVIHIQIRARLDDPAHNARARMMAEQPRTPPLRGPTPIAIHDNRNMARAGSVSIAWDGEAPVFILSVCGGA